MARAPITATEAAGDALDFVRWAWRRAWAVQALAAVGPALLFVALRGRLSSSQAWDLWSIGWALILSTMAPLVAALVRVRLGGKALRGLGPAGLQLGLAELRLFLMGIASLGAALLAWLPVVAASALVFVAFRGAGMTHLPVLGQLRISFLVAASVWLAAFAACAYAASRLSVAIPATVGKRRLVLVDAWALGRDTAWPVLGGLAFSLMPALLTLVAAFWIDQLAVQDPDWGALRTWAASDALIAGLLFGAVLSFVQAPFSLGVVCAAYCAQRRRRTDQTGAPPRLAAFAPRSTLTVEPFAPT